MKTVQRIYLYLVSAISLTAITWAVILLARLVLREEIGRGQLTELASLLAVIIVGLPIFLFHWFMAQRLAAKDIEERASIIRRIFFGGLMATGATPIISNVYRLVDNLFLALLGGIPKTYYPYNLTTGEHLAAIIAWGIVWFYLWRELQIDNRLVPRRGDHLGVRRLYLLAFSQVGLVMVGLGGIGLLRTLMQSLATGINWQTPVADSSAQLLVGCGVWITHWLSLQRAFASGDPAEERSVLRKIYLYLNIFVFSVMAVVSASLLLKRLIELALGAPPTGEPLLSQLSGPLPLLIVGGVLWAYHWYVLRQDAERAPEVPRQASVRRVYAYLVAAIGLGVLLSGIVGLLSLLIDLLTTPAEIGLAYYREQVALFAAMIVVGLPVWLPPWRNIQSLALTPDVTRQGASAAEERRSTTRKIYLYFYVLVAALAVFGSTGWFVFHLLTALLGADLPEDFITQVLDALVIALLSGGVWVYHWQVLRQDGTLEQRDKARRLAEVSVVVIDGNEGELGLAIIQQLQHDLSGIQVKPIGLTSQAVAAMSGQPWSVEGVNTAHFIVGSWQTLSLPEIMPAVISSPALKLAIPATEPNWVWVGVRQRTSAYYVEQTVRGIKEVIESEEVSSGSERKD
ncbi:MAG: hypothetical protein JXM69_06940 [Anaerolineae bacterium]|nr:hypothetical protein [Anaerolineae bacterium]